MAILAAICIALLITLFLELNSTLKEIHRDIEAIRNHTFEHVGKLTEHELKLSWLNDVIMKHIRESSKAK